MTEPVKFDADEWRRWRPFVVEDIRVARGCLAIDPPAARQPLRKSHDLDELATLATPFAPRLSAYLDACRPLTLWAVDYRYPAEDELPLPEPGEIAGIIGMVEAFLADADRAISGE